MDGPRGPCPSAWGEGDRYGRRSQPPGPRPGGWSRSPSLRPVPVTPQRRQQILQLASVASLQPIHSVRRQLHVDQLADKAHCLAQPDGLPFLAPLTAATVSATNSRSAYCCSVSSSAASSLAPSVCCRANASEKDFHQDVRVEHEQGNCSHRMVYLCRSTRARADPSAPVSWRWTSNRILFRTTAGTVSGPVPDVFTSYQTIPVCR